MKFLITCALLAGMAAGQGPVTISDFEVQTAGQLVPLAPNPPDAEGWQTIGGAAMYMPDGTTVTGMCQLPLNGSSQWCEVNPQNVGPASPVVMPSTPGTWPFAQGSVAEIQLQTTAPVYASGQLAISVDWYWQTLEGPMGSTGTPPCPCNDFAQVAVIDPATQTLVATLLYVDTYPPFTVTAGSPCGSGITGALNGSTVGPAQTATVTLPAQFAGAPLLISVVAANQFDGMFESILWIDNLHFFDPSSQFLLTATTTGGGVGDLTYDITNINPMATHVQVLFSATPAPGGLGSGIAFGLVPDSLFVFTMLNLPAPMSLTHFPVSSNPFAGGPVNLPAGFASGLAGQTWELVALGYNAAAGVLELSNHQQVAW